MDASLTLAGWLAERRRGLSHQRWRGVLWIADDAPAAIDKAWRWIEASTWVAPLWIGPEMALPDGMTRLSASRARSELGSEHELVVFDAVSSAAGFDPDAFGAISGTVVAGGWLVLLTPKHWQQLEPANFPPDADYRRLAHWPHPVESLTARYLQRLANGLQRGVGLAQWPSQSALPFSPTFESIAPLPEVAIDDADCLTSDQAEAVARLTRMRRRRPVVLVADRGRGKSAALGIAAARRLRQGESRLWLTATNATAVGALFQRLQQLLPDGRRESNRFDVMLDGRHCCVEWLPPEQVMPALARAGIEAQSPPTLFVDEAASIPAARLMSWLQRFPRIAFATTVHGYEGTGRGFEVRLRDALDRLTPDWRRLQLNAPVRWAVGDPLETMTRELLCLDAEIVAGKAVAAAVNATPVTYVWLDRARLARDEGALTSMFGLLVHAHYRTSPSDLRHLLDGPDVHLLAAFAGDMAVGICVVQQEGGFDTALADAIYRGQRRPRGHLLAQSLATHGGYQEAALASWWRIMRIAVHPAARGMGMGAALIEQAATTAQAHGVDRLGVSFGAEPGLIRFWRRQGFCSVRVGLTREPSSGEPALMMGRGLTASARRVITTMADDYRLLLPDLLAGELKDIDPLIAAAWLHEGPAPGLADDVSSRLAWFAQGGGELASVRPWLRLAWLGWWRQQPLASVLATPPMTPANDVMADDWLAAGPVSAVVAALFQYHQAALSSLGRRERQVAARRLAGALLSWHDGSGHAKAADADHLDATPPR